MNSCVWILIHNKYVTTLLKEKKMKQIAFASGEKIKE